MLNEMMDNAVKRVTYLRAHIAWSVSVQFIEI